MFGYMSPICVFNFRVFLGTSQNTSIDDKKNIAVNSTIAPFLQSFSNSESTSVIHCPITSPSSLGTQLS